MKEVLSNTGRKNEGVSETGHAMVRLGARNDATRRAMVQLGTHNGVTVCAMVRLHAQ